MEKVYEFLKNAGVYYIATVDGDQPHVRPFGTVNIFPRMFPSRLKQTEKWKFLQWLVLTAGSD